MIGIDHYMKRLTAWVICVWVGVMALDACAQVAGAADGEAVNVSLLRRVQQARLLSGVDEISWDRSSGAPRMLAGTDLAAVAGASVPLKLDDQGAQVPDYARGALNVMAGLSGIYGISDAATELVSRRVDTDTEGYRHVVVDQRHGGVPVIGGTTIAHFDAAGSCRLLNGRFVADLDLDTTPLLIPAAAEAAALVAAAGRGHEGARAGEGTSLVVWARDGLRVLAYRVCVLYDHPEGGIGEWRYVVNANSGAIALDYDNRHEIADPGPVGEYETITGEIMSGEGGGVKAVAGWADEATGASYLWNEEETWGIFNKGGAWPDGNTYCHRFTNDWAETDTAAMSTAYNFSSTLDYFRSVHARNSFDGAGAMAQANIHVPGLYYNAYWSPAAQQFSFGYMYNMSGRAGMGVMDIAAHEFTHAVTEHTAGLIYRGESGALNESFSDIFGALVEFYVQPDGSAAYTNKISGHADWLMGEDLEEGTNSFEAIRDMRDPMRMGDPSRYQGTYWVDTSSWYDNGGVHFNSGVQNHFFYLLCEGGIGTNDTLFYDMTPLGMAGAEKVAYLALTSYCTPSTGYLLGREAWLAAAWETDDAGVTTNSWIPVTAAWTACGVGDAPSVIPDEPFVPGCRFPNTAPVTPTNKEYMVVNYSTSTQSWDVASSNAVDWLTFEPATFTLGPMSYTTVVVNVVVSNALAATAGVHKETIIFDSTDDAYDTVRDCYLRNGKNYQVRSTDFSWVDPIARSHERLYFPELNEYQIFHDFGFYEFNYPKMYVSPKGVVGFLDEGLNSGPQSIPDVAARNGITAPFWEELRLVQGSGVYIGHEGQPPNRYTVISWIDMAHPANRMAHCSFQMLIREQPGVFGNNDIIFQYLDVNDAYDTFALEQQATVGVEDHEGIVGREYASINTPLWVADDQAILYTDYLPPDTTPPTGEIRVLSRTETSAIMEVAFDEVVQGLTNTALTVSGNLTASYEVEGSGARYLIHLTNLGSMGALEVSVSADSVVDMAGNTNVVAIGPGRYAKAIIDENFFDDMESGTANWETSEGDYVKFTQRGWEWGTSSLVGGSTCWGTVLNGPYYNSMNAYVQSREIAVGDQPVLEFKLWESFPTYNYITPDNDLGYVEVFNGVGWHDVTPGGPYQWPRAHSWAPQEITLDPALFANRLLRVRFRVESNGSIQDYGMYVDDVRLRSQRASGLWVLSVTPTPVTPDSTVDLYFELYNGTTGTCHSVTGEVTSSERGISFANGTQVTYGDLGPGEVRTSSALTVTLADAQSILSNPIGLVHAATCAEGILSTDYLDLAVTMATTPASTAELDATTTQSVRDWMAVPLSGDGGDLSSYFQVISAGADGVVNLPGAGGGPTGDDRVLYTKATSIPDGRFGAGPTTPPEMGKFEQEFGHTLSTGSVVYVRAWDGVGYSDSIAYGESGTFAVTTSVSQVIDFGAWTVGTPVDMRRDLNGDTVPDGYDVLRGADARVPVGPLQPSWESSGEAGELGSASTQMQRPGRVAQFSTDFVFVADTENDRIQTWSADLSTLVSTYTGQGVTAGTLNWPQGLAIDFAFNRLVVADTKHDRLVLLTIDPATGVLTYERELSPTGGSFDQPYDVAVTASGQMLVADTFNHQVVRLSATGVWLSTMGSNGSGPGFMRFPRGVCVGPNDQIYVADSQNHRVQVFSSAGMFVSVLGGISGTNGVEFASPAGVAVDDGGRLYVADSGNSRMQIFSSNLVYLATYKPPAGEMGSGPGQLRAAQGVCPSLDGYGVYVADTWNNRVQLLNITLDSDGDGMSDLWEDANGLDSTDPTDADRDSDVDGVSNLGEYRVGTDPFDPDSNDDGVNDRESMIGGVNPIAPFPPHAGIAICDAKATTPGDVLTWEAIAGATYRIERSVDLPATVWARLDTVTVPQAGVVSWTNTVPSVATRYFYRIRKQL